MIRDDESSINILLRKKQWQSEATLRALMHTNKPRDWYIAILRDNLFDNDIYIYIWLYWIAMLCWNNKITICFNYYNINSQQYFPYNEKKINFKCEFHAIIKLSSVHRSCDLLLIWTPLVGTLTNFI